MSRSAKNGESRLFGKSPKKCKLYFSDAALRILTTIILRAQIQNAGLGEFRIRDLNDEINKLLREKRHWENQISNLGGKQHHCHYQQLLY